MTRRAFADAAVQRLQAAGIPDAAFEVRCLLEDFGGMPHGALPDTTPLPASSYARLETAVEERLAGRPLQYILGTWDFLQLRLAVGEGVLIPRQDTECLCLAAAELLGSISGRIEVLDLCAGSGCVGLGLASLLPQASVTAVEYSPDALRFLEENCRRYPQYDVTPVQGNVFTDAAAFPKADAILANPPYIPHGELSGLMREVRREPAAALDGGEDGLVFYRVIAADWACRLRPGGLLAVEIGWEQGAVVRSLFEAAGLQNCRIVRDYAGKDRVVTGFQGNIAQKQNIRSKI